MQSMAVVSFFFFFFFFFVLVASPAVHAGSCARTVGGKTYKKCMTLPTQTASIAWTFHPRNATLEIAFSGSFISPTGWVGWGINPISAEMTETRALIAFSDPNSGRLVVLPYFLDPTVKLQRTPLLSRPLDNHLLSSSASLYGGKAAAAAVHEGAAVQIYGAFKLEPNRTKIHLVWNRGLYVQGYSPAIHPTADSDLASTATIDITSGAATTGHPKFSSLKSTHAVLNSVTWGFILPVGALTARYLRQIQSVGPTWFYAHAAVQLAGFALGTTGFAIGIRLGSMSPGVTYGLHRKLGIAAFSLGALQTLALMFRPKTTHKFRKYWKSYHHFVGYACVVLGVVNVFQGFEVMGLGASYAKMGYCLALATLVGICIALEVNSWVLFCRKAKEEKMRRDAMAGRFDKGSASN